MRRGQGLARWNEPADESHVVRLLGADRASGEDHVHRAAVGRSSVQHDDLAFNTTISNIPGSPKAVYCPGARVVSQHPVNVLIEGPGLSITLLSYQDRLDFGLTGDRLVPDVWDLKNDREAELAELADAIGVTAPAKASPRR